MSLRGGGQSQRWVFCIILGVGVGTALGVGVDVGIGVALAAGLARRDCESEEQD